MERAANLSVRNGTGRLALHYRLPLKCDVLEEGILRVCSKARGTVTNAQQK